MNLDLEKTNIKEEGRQLLHKWEGIVLKSIPYGESNKIVTLFTEEAGKVTAMARGAKKPASRLAAMTQPFLLGSFLVYAGGKGMGQLQQGELIDSMRDLRGDLEKTAYASFIVELIDRLTEPMEERTRGVYHLLKAALHAIDEGFDPEVITLFVEWQMLPVAGIYPVVHQCAHCRATEGEFAFSFQQIGLLCHRCYDVDPYITRLSPTQVRLIRTCMTVPIDQLGNISLKKPTVRFLQKVVRTIYDEQTGIRLKSRRFIDQLERDTLLQQLMHPNEQTKPSP